MKKLFITLSCMLISACVKISMPQYGWYKEGVSQEEATTTLADCTYKVGMNKVEAYKEQKLITSCMEASGFRWRVLSQ